MDLIKSRGPVIWLFWGLPLFFSLKRFSLNLFLDEFLSFFFQLFIQDFIIMFHNALYRHSGSNNISESSHPHIPLVGILCAKHKQPLWSLDIKWICPVFGQISLFNLAFRQITIADISEGNDFLIRLNRLVCFFICSERLFSNENTSKCEINNEVSLGVNWQLEHFNMLHKLFEVALHLVALELDGGSLLAVPRPKLLVTLLNHFLVTGRFRKLYLQGLRIV